MVLGRQTARRSLPSLRRAISDDTVEIEVPLYRVSTSLLYVGDTRTKDRVRRRPVGGSIHASSFDGIGLRALQIEGEKLGFEGAWHLRSITTV